MTCITASIKCSFTVLVTSYLNYLDHKCSRQLKGSLWVCLRFSFVILMFVLFAPFQCGQNLERAGQHIIRSFLLIPQLPGCKSHISAALELQTKGHNSEWLLYIFEIHPIRCSASRNCLHRKLDSLEETPAL